MSANICKMVFSPALAATLNWIGTDKKKGIKNSMCGKCIVGKYIFIFYQ